MDKISIIIPTHNVAQLVIPTLQSLGTLDGLDLIREVIFSDGGSDDSTEEIASACGQNSFRVPLAGASSCSAVWKLPQGHGC